LKKEGFILKDGLWEWSPEEEQSLKDILDKISRGEVIPHTVDPFYFISHHHFDGKIPEQCVKEKVLSFYPGYTALESLEEVEESDTEEVGSPEIEGESDVDETEVTIIMHGIIMNQ
jgi:hypothetical protein